MSALSRLLNQFQEFSQTQRDKGTSFENLIIKYFQTEPCYQSRYVKVQTYCDWAAENIKDLGFEYKNDTGIDLVLTDIDGSFHAVQCKNYSSDRTIQKSDIDSFFTASGKTWFTHRYIVATTDKWSNNARESLNHQIIPVSVINLADLENSSIDWEQFNFLPGSLPLNPKRVCAHINKVP